MEMDRSCDEVDPRVQIELERLNTATDDINKLEVDLDEARAAFRQLLCESTVRIDILAKKLGSCIERSRPYYDARMKAKEALLETQHAAVRFERANSAHSAAREMVFLAEEGLCAEGRTFDHAWQEMLNHATMRVNESEAERTLSELEHRRTSQLYHRSEMRVQQLQKELKRAIAKSSLNARRSMLQINSLAYRQQLQLLPYFEMKAQFNQLLEDQKKKVKNLETQVSQAKTTYAQALRNLEQISDEIHRTRKYESGMDPLGARGSGVGADSPLPNPDCPDKVGRTPTGQSSSSDVWSDSTGTGPPDSDSGEEYLKLPEKLGPTASPTVNKSDTENPQVSDYLGLTTLSNSIKKHRDPGNRPMAELPVLSQNTFHAASMSPRHTASKTVNKIVETSFVDKQKVARKLDFDTQVATENKNEGLQPLLNTSMKREDSQIWTEISLVESPEEARPFAKMGPNAAKIDRDYIHYCPLENSSKSEPSSFSSVLRNPLSFTLPKSDKILDKALPSSPAKKVANWLPSLASKNQEDEAPLASIDEMSTISDLDKNPGKTKLDTSLSGWISRSTTEPPGNSSSLNRRQSLDVLWGGPTTERVKELLSHGMMMLNISSLTERRASEPRVPSDTEDDGAIMNLSDGFSSEMIFSGRESRITKKVPSPLEKSLTYLNAEDDSTSDSESLASVEMLTDEQISSLMLEQDIQDACEQVLGTPISEISPLIQELKILEQKTLDAKEPQ